MWQRNPADSWQSDIVGFRIGGVFVTWRQKDPKETDLGLYGKKRKTVDAIAECNDIALVGISDVNDDIVADGMGGRAIKRPNIAINRTKLNSVWKTKSKSKLHTKVIYENESRIQTNGTSILLTTCWCSERVWTNPHAFFCEYSMYSFHVFVFVPAQSHAKGFAC